jgi:hypothetical protein
LQLTSYYKHIPLITPPVINGQTELRLFILNELIKAIKQLQNRIRAIGHEDNYSDLIQSILCMRFPFYGWHITEDPRRGFSESGVNAGEPDLIIQASDEDIALIEALILNSRNYQETRRHILKCINYSRRMDQYYILVYYRGETKDFISCWENYKEDVRNIDFPADKCIKTHEEQFLEINFDNASVSKIAKTRHEGNLEIYHAFADFSNTNALIKTNI